MGTTPTRCTPILRLSSHWKGRQKPKLDDFSRPRITQTQFRNNGIEGKHVLNLILSKDCDGVQRKPRLPEIPFGATDFAGVIHKYVSHLRRRDRKEVLPVVAIDGVGAESVKQCLVHQFRCLWRVVWTLPPKLRTSEHPQLPIDERDKLFFGFAITLIYPSQEDGNVAASGVMEEQSFTMRDLFRVSYPFRVGNAQ